MRREAWARIRRQQVVLEMLVLAAMTSDAEAISGAARPHAINDGYELQLARIHDHMLHLLSVVRVRDMYKAIFRLNHCGIRVLSPLPFEDRRRVPSLAVFADGEIDHFTTLGKCATSRGVVVDQQLPPILK